MNQLTVLRYCVYQRFFPGDNQRQTGQTDSFQLRRSGEGVKKILMWRAKAIIPASLRVRGKMANTPVIISVRAMR